MLLQMRSFTRTLVAYVFMAVLVVGLGFWGISNILVTPNSHAVAQVDGLTILPAELSRELDLMLRSQRQNGNNVTQAEAVEQGVHLRVLESLIGRRAAQVFEEKLGVGASDAQVAERIRQVPNVRNALTGAFDEASYDAFLHEVHYTRADFEQEIRNEITSTMLLDALGAGVRAPSSYGALLLAFQSERRIVSIAEAPASLAGAVADPSAAELQTFYQESAEQFRVPEYRALTLVRAHQGDFAARVSVSEDQLRQEFESRRAGLTEPEKRSFIRIAASTEAQAQQAVTRVNAGEAPEAAARALGLQFIAGEHEARNQIADAPVAEAVFSMQANAPARAVRGQLSPWTVVKVTAIVAARSPNFAAAREQLRQEIANTEAGEMLRDAMDRFDEDRGAGAGVAQAARAAGLPTTAIAGVDAQGRTSQGQQVEGLTPEMIQLAFQTPEGEASDFLPSGDADVLVAVDRVLPSSVRPLAEVSGPLKEAWKARARVLRLRAVGDAMTQAVGGGQSFAAAARAAHIRVVISSQSLDRQSARQIPSRQLGSLIFTAHEGEVVSDMRADGGALLVAVVENIHRDDPAEATQQVEQGRQQVAGSLGQSLAEALQAEIVARARVRRNNVLIQQIFNPQSDPSQSGAEDGTAP